MSDAGTLSATVFEYTNLGFQGSNRDLWSELAEDVAQNYPDRYRFDRRRPMSLFLLDTTQTCPSESDLMRIRVIRANVVRSSQHVILLELALGNCFSVDNGDCISTADMGRDGPRKAKWMRAVGMIPHREHIERVRRFILDAGDCGWDLPQIDLDLVPTGPVTLINAKGKHSYQQKMARSLSRAPLIPMQGNPLVIIEAERGQATGVERSIVECLARSFGDSIGKAAKPSILPPMSPIPEDALALVLLPDDIDLSKSEDWRSYLFGLDSRKRSFKLCKISTLRNRWGFENMCYNLFQLDGGCAWSGVYRKLNDVVAVDAGHDVEANRSLWISSAYALANNGITMRFHLCRLHEDIPSDVIEDISVLAAGRSVTFFRDGRFHKGEVRALEAHGIPNDQLLYITKSPGALLFRGDMEDPQLPRFGDCVRYSDKSMLLQSIEPSSNDYERPILLRGVTGIDGDIATDVMTLCKQPTLGLYHDSRLPGPIYWTDMASKRTVSGWAKAIGRGWGLPALELG